MKAIGQHKRLAMGKGYADGGEVKAPPAPPQLGGLAGDAQKKLSGRGKQLDDMEAQALGKKRGGRVR